MKFAHSDLARALKRFPCLGVLSFALLGFLLAAGTSLLTGVPLPETHDEFSYLLAGDTFASGRLANPSHAHWEHFETFHVLQQPTYASKYPPGQGIFLGVGQALFGRPVVGVWLSIGFMCGAMLWMFRQWLSNGWALLAGLIVVVHVGIPSYWTHSYWGGAVAAGAGALLFGGVRGFARQPRFVLGVVTGTGVGILALTRPLEGFLATMFAAALLVAVVFRRRDLGRKLLLKTAVLPALVSISVFLGFFGYYNWRVTGEVTQMPYLEYNEQYGTAGIMGWWERDGAPTFRHPEFRRLVESYGRASDDWKARGYSATLPMKFQKLGLFYLGPLALALLAVPFLLRDRWIQFAAITSIGVLTLVLNTNQAWPHYGAPVAGLLFFIATASLRQLRQSLGGWLVPAFLLLLMTAFTALRVWSLTGPRGDGFPQQRNEILAFLDERPGKDLVLVRYDPGHEDHYAVNHEFVYNRASIDDAGVVWARDMGEAKNESLIEYFRERNVWLLEVGERTRLSQLVPGAEP